MKSLMLQPTKSNNSEIEEEKILSLLYTYTDHL